MRGNRLGRLAALASSAALLGAVIWLALRRNPSRPVTEETIQHRECRAQEYSARSKVAMNESTRNQNRGGSNPKGSSMPMMYLLAITFLFSAAIVADLMLRGTRVLPEEPRFAVEGGDVERGREAILHYGCGACHTIPGIREATGRVGPQLAGLRDQIYLAGVLPNSPENLVAWILDPKKINPLTAMPSLPIMESEARDIAAYLYQNPGRN